MNLLAKKKRIRVGLRLLLGCLLVLVVLAPVACYPIGHEYHSEQDHAEALRNMNPQDPPYDDRVE